MLITKVISKIAFFLKIQPKFSLISLIREPTFA